MLKANVRLNANIIAFVLGGISTFVGFFLPVYFTTVGFSGFEIGVMVSAFLLATLIASIPAGMINDVFSIRTVLIFAIALNIIFFVGIVVLPSLFWLILFLSLIRGIGTQTLSNTVEILTLKNAKNETKGKHFGEYSLYKYSGSAIGAIIGGAATLYMGFSIVFALIAAIFLLMIVPAWQIKRKGTIKIKLRDYKEDFLKPKTILLAIVLFLFTLHWGAELTSYGLFLKNFLYLDSLWSGVYIGSSIFFLAIAAFVGGKIIDKKVNYKKIFVSGIFISGISNILMVNPNAIISFLFRIIHEIGDGLFFVTQFVWILLLFEKERIGGNYGIIYTVMILGTIAGALIFAPLGEMIGYEWPFIVSGAIVVIEAILLAVYIFGKNPMKKV